MLHNTGMPQLGLGFQRSHPSEKEGPFLLVSLGDGQVPFRYKDYQRGHRLCTLTLESVEFLRRLMLHVPPHGFHRMRHFGFLANRVRKEKLAQCRTLLGHGKDLESLGQSQGEPHVELLPRPKNRSNHAAIVNLSMNCENQCGPHLLPQQHPCVIENIGPPDMREAALT